MRVNLFYYLTATALGGLHALEPGHGKTVVAAYLIGTKGRKIDAVLLGLVVTITHTFSVILLAIAAKLASTRITLTDESLHGYLGLVAGLLILIVGMWMLVGRLRGREPFHFHSHEHGHGHSHGHSHPHNPEPLHGHSHPHDHSHDDDHGHEHHDAQAHSDPYQHSHEHGHDLPHRNNPGHAHDHDHTHNHNPIHPHHHSHGHDHDHGHEHHDAKTNGDIHTHVNDHSHNLQTATANVQGQQRLGYWQLCLLGVSGGLVPCPAAIAILLAAVGAGRLGEGLTYILLFSVGLAAVLIAVGMAVVGAGKIASRFLDAKRFARKVSIASAAIITLIGVVTLLNSLRHVI